MKPRVVEMPTLLVAVAVHAGWLALTWWHALLPGWALAVGGAWLVAWHGSLQHETIHGHPTSRPWLNALIGGVPLSLWLPYSVYRRSHVAHHDTPAITDPFDDPESRYLAHGRSRLAVGLRRVESTLLGRMLVGPLLTVGSFLVSEAARLGRDPRGVARDWLPHLVAVLLVLAWLRVCGLGVDRYVLLCVYPGIALTLLRSFAEHRADPVPGHRVAIVERPGLLGLLYLNNNLHAAHHHAPGVAWYALPAYHARHRATLLAGNGGLLYRGYGEVLGRYLLRPHDTLVHPDHG